ncbi:hypothetical protein GQ44DRAFT_775259 [Phaeosphaeriaceae sp. PMI808]|nr:hypothetical protein GQ44DRAFT_775259 [Phaeosphaeriaceae sp. PMI808]
MVEIDILELSEGGECTQRSGQLVNGSKISRSMQGKEQEEPLPRYGYMFSRESIPKQQNKRAELYSYFEPPALILNDAYRRANGNFGCATSYDEKGQLSKCIKLVSNEKLGDSEGKKGKKGEDTEVTYKWFEMLFLSRWEPNSCVMLCINTPRDMLLDLKTALSSNPVKPDFRDPFSLYSPLMDEVVKLYDRSVWAIRDVLRPIEKKREKEKSHINVDFSQLQEILRHSIHVGEVLAVGVATTTELRKCRKKLMPRLPRTKATDSGNQDEASKNEQVAKGEMEGKYDWGNDPLNYHFGFQTQMMQNTKFRQQSNQDRLNSEITLAYNMITQQDSKVIKGDSKAMKTVALLTMVFLPATFTSAIFSMTFFNFTPATNDAPGKWTMSNKIYMFWLIAGGLTVLTILVWFLWQYREGKDFSRERGRVGDVEKGEKEGGKKEGGKVEKQM